MPPIMHDTTPDKSSSLSPVGEWFFAIVFWIAGALILALAVGWIPAPPERFGAPHWVVGAAGFLFIAGGFVPLTTRLGPNSWASRCVGAAVLWPLALIFNWIAFGAGPRHFSGGLSLGGLGISQSAGSDTGGRIAFGIAAVMLDLFVVVVAVRWMRNKRGG
jgi:hypothetical protein